jgi:DNA polymerase IV (archaeal DinB-like DNA polymerase)
MKKRKIIMHIDMDYFFAQVEERENPEFKGKAVVVGADPKNGKGRGVVSTSNYKAREYEIRSGMPISRAYKLNPKAIFLPVNMNLYKKTALSIFKILEKEGPKIEKISLDEAYIDLTERCKSLREAKKIGEKVKSEILKKEKLTATVGIAENKMLAKIACESAKPNGIKVILPKNSLSFISNLDIQKIPGIGPKSKKKIEEHLNKRNPKIKDASKIKKEELVNLFGKRGKDFFKRFKGVDDSAVLPKRKIKSVGREHTFQKDTRDPEKITKIFRNLVSVVTAETQKKNLMIKGVVVIFRFEDFKKHTKQVTFKKGNYCKEFIYKKSVPLLLRFLVENNKKIRLIGFRVIIE